MKRFILAAVFLTGLQSAMAQQYFGYFSYNDALRSMPEYAEVQQNLSSLRNRYDQEMERSEKELNKQFSDFVADQKSFTENILIKRQKELTQLMQQSIEFKDECKRLLRQAEEEMMEPVRARLSDVITEIGKEKGYDCIINTDSNTLPYVNTEKGEDLTALIRNRIR